MRFDVTILGCAGATPTLERFPSAQVVNVNERNYLIDCGEGAQMQMLKFGIKKHRIDAIFISHLHGDHYFGLLGLLTSMHLEQRLEPITLVCPMELKAILELNFSASNSKLCYVINYRFTQAKKPELVYENKDIVVTSFPLVHRIPTTGFLIKENEKLKKIDIEKVKQYQIPTYYLKEIKNGNDYENQSGEIIKNEWLTLPPDNPKSYAYCSDTLYNENVIDTIKNATLLYHEATFTNEHLQRANETYHSTASQAADIAQKANVSKLIIGHYSAKYKTLDGHLAEAMSVFHNTVLGHEGLVVEV
jgi:ribonuclease Z